MSATGAALEVGGVTITVETLNLALGAMSRGHQDVIDRGFLRLALEYDEVMQRFTALRDILVATDLCVGTENQGRPHVYSSDGHCVYCGKFDDEEVGNVQ